MPHFDDQWIVCKTFQQRLKMRHSLTRPMKRKRELQQHSAQFSSVVQYVEPRAHRALVFCRCGGDSRAYCAARVCRSDFVREALPKFRRKDEPRICGHAVDPLRRMVRPNRIVEGSVDLDCVKEFREVRRLMKTFLFPRWINISSPVRIGPPRGADANYRFGALVI